MDVAVLHKRGQLLLRSAGKTSLLGHGLLERVRATSLAMLGVTASVGLAMVALALNQSWPLVAGSSIPVISPQRQVVGEATIAARAGSSNAHSRVANAANGSRLADSGAGGAADAAPNTGAPPATGKFVISPLSPARPKTAGSPEGPDNSPASAVSQPKDAAESPAGAAAPTAVSPPSPPAGVTEPAPPPATTAEVPDEESESNLPPWSHGKGHAYGRDSEKSDDDKWHGHGYGASPQSHFDD